MRAADVEDSDRPGATHEGPSRSASKLLADCHAPESTLGADLADTLTRLSDALAEHLDEEEGDSAAGQ